MARYARRRTGGSAPAAAVRAALAALAVLAPLAPASGCASPEGLHSDGRAEDVKAPLALWPRHTPAPPGRDENPGALKPVPGVPRIPSGDMKDARPVDVVTADLTSDGQRAPDPRAVRAPVLHDLTDDGKSDLIIAVDLADGRTSELRVYSVRDRVVTRILGLRAVLAGVELAAGYLVVREPTKDPRYVSVTDYVWDDGVMGPWSITLDDYHKGRQGSGPKTPSAGPSVEPSAGNAR